MSKKITTVFLVCFLAAAVLFWGARAYMESQKEDSKVSTVLTVYYFHGNKRCRTCNTIERYTKEAVESAFAAMMKKGTLLFRSVNVDKAENEHFIKRFDLRGKLVVLAFPDNKGEGRFRKLPKVWTHVRDRDAFFSYIQQNVREFFQLKTGGK